MDKVIINKLRTRAIIGILDFERVNLQDVFVSVTIYTRKRSQDSPDDISICLDYSVLSDEICSLVEKAHRFTLEALAEDIASFCLDHPRVRKVTVLVEKPGAIPDAAFAGVEIERKKNK